MLPGVVSRNHLVLVAFAIAAFAAFALVPRAGAEVAHSSDAAGDAYATAIAKAKEKRAVKLKACAQKPKAKRAACRKAANTAFAKAQEKAKEQRDQTRQGGGSADPGSGDPRDEYRDCVKAGGDPSECKSDAKGGK